jgi:hypothetical protein
VWNCSAIYHAGLRASAPAPFCACNPRRSSRPDFFDLFRRSHGGWNSLFHRCNSAPEASAVFVTKFGKLIEWHGPKAEFVPGILSGPRGLQEVFLEEIILAWCAVDTCPCGICSAGTGIPMAGGFVSRIGNRSAVKLFYHTHGTRETSWALSLRLIRLHIYLDSWQPGRRAGV